MSKNLAPERLILKHQSLHRNKDIEVRIVDDLDGATIVTIPKDQWQAVADFFHEIAHPDSLL